MEKHPYHESQSPITIPQRVLKKIKGGNGVTEEDIQLLEEMRPHTRADCQNGERPCPFVGCRHHLYLDVNKATGSIKLNFPDQEVWKIPQTCALDVAEKGGITLEEIGEILNLTRERVRQIETGGFISLLKQISRDDNEAQKLLTDYLGKKAEKNERTKAWNMAYKRRHQNKPVSLYEMSKEGLDKTAKATKAILASCQT